MARPGSGRLLREDSHAVALERVHDGLAQVALAAARAGVTYCIEPLAKRETPLVNTVAEAAHLVRAIDQSSLKTMIDCSAAGLTETETIAELIDRWMPTGLIAHIQLNDPNRRGPGQGEMKFAAVLAALKRNRYAGTVAVEPFDYFPDGPSAAALAIGYGAASARRWRKSGPGAISVLNESEPGSSFMF